MSTFAAWQRPPRPSPRVICCVCYQRVRLRDTWPIWDREERICLDCVTVDDRRRHRLDHPDVANVRPPGLAPASQRKEENE